MKSTESISLESLEIGADYILFKNKFLGKGAFGNLYLGKTNLFYAN